MAKNDKTLSPWFWFIGIVAGVALVYLVFFTKYRPKSKSVKESGQAAINRMVELACKKCV